MYDFPVVVMSTAVPKISSLRKRSPSRQFGVVLKLFQISKFPASQFLIEFFLPGVCRALHSFEDKRLTEARRVAVILAEGGCVEDSFIFDEGTPPKKSGCC